MDEQAVVKEISVPMYQAKGWLQFLAVMEILGGIMVAFTIIGIIFAWLPIYIFRRRGGVPEGKGYVHTTVLVDTGLYSIVRHPQYTAGILLSISLILISQSLLILVIGGVVVALLYIDILLTDKHEIEKFGDEYKLYMKRVPRTNFLLGIIRSYLRIRKKETL